MLQLRFASLLYEDTENDGQVEAMLSKGVIHKRVAFKRKMVELIRYRLPFVKRYPSLLDRGQSELTYVESIARPQIQYAAPSHKSFV